MARKQTERRKSMGYYIETKGNFGKAATIAAEWDGIVLKYSPRAYSDIPEGKALIVVVDNGMFEAAAFCYDEEEFKYFTDSSDPRPKLYVLLDRELAEQLSGYNRKKT
jgi:hypothetical protein